jgi:hypothetical protein
VSARVEIVRAEAITVAPLKRSMRKTDRQYRLRNSVPMIEFY